jgi:hypothetical protein
MIVTPEELFAGAGVTYPVRIPPRVLNPGKADDGTGEAREIRLRPLTVRDVQLIAKAAKDDEVLTSALMIQRASVEPELKPPDVAAMHGGLVRFLVEQINRISGLTTDEDDLREIVDAPVVQAFYLLAREFGWTPQQVRQLTLGEILGYVEMLNRHPRGGAA